MPHTKKTSKEEPYNAFAPVPSKIRKHIDMYSHVERLAELGMTIEQIAYSMKISTQAMYLRFEKDPELLESIKRGKALGIQKVTETAFQMATSGKDTTMTIFWLKTQARWRDQDNININLVLSKYGVKDVSEMSLESLNHAISEISSAGEKPGVCI